MENASNALLMAAGVILSIIIISAAVLTYNSMHTSQFEIDKIRDAEEITKENEKFLAFEKSFMYGSEIFSLANLVEDYNSKNENTGRIKIVVYVQFVEEIKETSGAVILQKKTYSIEDAMQKIQAGSKQLQTDFKRKFFFCQQSNTKYDEAGRVKEMSFVQAI